MLVTKLINSKQTVFLVLYVWNWEGMGHFETLIVLPYCFRLILHKGGQFGNMKKDACPMFWQSVDLDLSPQTSCIEALMNQHAGPWQLPTEREHCLSLQARVGDVREGGSGDSAAADGTEREGARGNVSLTTALRPCSCCLHSNRSLEWCPSELVCNLPNAHLIIAPANWAFHYGCRSFLPMCHNMATATVCMKLHSGLDSWHVVRRGFLL